MSNLVTSQKQTYSKGSSKFTSFFKRFTNTELYEVTPTQILHNELRNLQKQLEFKEINFIHAEPEYIDVAIMELEAVRAKYSITVRHLKKLTDENILNQKLFS